MNRIPVGQTIAAAYRFAFLDLEKVIALIWLPIIVLTVGDYFVTGSVLSARSAAVDMGDQSQLGPVMVGQLAYVLVALLLKAVIGVAICREILKPLQRPLWLRFSLGAEEFRFLGAMLALVALMGLAVMLCVFAGSALAGSMPAIVPGQAAIGAGVLVGLVLSPVLIYAFIRLGSLMLPVAVLEETLGLERSWQLLKGNVGRMLLVSLAVGVPVILVYLLLYGLIIGPAAFNPHLDLTGDTAALARHQAEVMRQTAAHLPWLEGLEFLMAPFLYGLGFAAPAYAYKALTAAAPPSA